MLVVGLAVVVTVIALSLAAFLCATSSALQRIKNKLQLLDWHCCSLAGSQAGFTGTPSVASLLACLAVASSTSGA